MKNIGVRELRQHASVWLARVAAGETFIVTDRGRPVATLAPVHTSRWEALQASGSVVPATMSLLDAEPSAGDGSSALGDALAADRADDDR